LKHISSEELVRAVRIVASGDSIIDPRLTGTLFGMIRETRDSGRRRTPLSAQERRLLPLVAQGLTNKEIAREMKLSDKTVKNYLVSVPIRLADAVVPHGPAARAPCPDAHGTSRHLGQGLTFSRMFTGFCSKPFGRSNRSVRVVLSGIGCLLLQSEPILTPG
jgi:hypothetical protein